MNVQNYDDKDLAMTGIVILCIVGGSLLTAVGIYIKNVSAIVGGLTTLFSLGVTALGTLATGRKNGNG